MITAEYLRDVVVYCAETGVFTWKRAFCFKVVVGKRAGSLSTAGYRYIAINGRRYLAHRLAWLYMTGEWPEMMIDHIDRNPDNNAWKNLRAANKAENAINSKMNKKNRSGFKGVSWHSKGQKWQAAVKVYGKSVFLGLFEDASEAGEAYRHAVEKHYSEFLEA